MENMQGATIKSLRKKAGFKSQSSLAETINVSRSAVYDWERGKYFPEGKNLINLAHVFNVSMEFLCGITGSECADDARPVCTASSSCPDETTIKVTASGTDFITFEFSSKLRKDITAEELNALFDEAKARVWGFLQPVKG